MMLTETFFAYTKVMHTPDLPLQLTHRPHSNQQSHHQITKTTTKLPKPQATEPPPPLGSGQHKTTSDFNFFLSSVSYFCTFEEQKRYFTKNAHIVAVN